MLNPERYALVNGRMILLCGVDDYDFGTTTIAQFQEVGSSVLLKLRQRQRHPVHADLKCRIMDKSGGKHCHDLFNIRPLSGDRHREPCTRPFSLAKLFRAHDKRAGARLCPHYECAALTVTPGFDLVLITETEQPVATYPVAPVGLPEFGISAFGKFDLGALVLQAVISKGHPALAELRGRHAVAVINDREWAARLGGEKQIDLAGSGIPRVRYELGQSDLGHMSNRAEFTKKVVFLK
jgi:hypothetical protein